MARVERGDQPLDRAALAGRVPALEQDARPEARGALAVRRDLAAERQPQLGEPRLSALEALRLLLSRQRQRQVELVEAAHGSIPSRGRAKDPRAPPEACFEDEAPTRAGSSADPGGDHRSGPWPTGPRPPTRKPNREHDQRTGPSSERLRATAKVDAAPLSLSSRRWRREPSRSRSDEVKEALGKRRLPRRRVGRAGLVPRPAPGQAGARRGPGRASARPSSPRRSRAPPAASWSACSATRASTRPRRCTSGTTASSCCGSRPRRRGDRAGRTSQGDIFARGLPADAAAAGGDRPSSRWCC